MWHVIPQSLDAGPLGVVFEAESAEAAAALAVAGPYATHANEVMVVRWNVRTDANGEMLFARRADIQVPVVAPAAAERPSA